MANDKIDMNAVSARLKILADDGKLFGAAGKALPILAAAYHKALVKLIAAIDAIKPKPDKNAELKSIKELQGKLHIEAAARAYDLAQKQEELTQGGLSPVGQKKIMLRNLVELTNICLQQHTGEKAAETYNRRGAREILLALKSLKDSSGHLETVDKSTKKFGDGRHPLSAKSKVSDLKDLLDAADATVKASKLVETALANYQDEVGKGVKELAVAVSAATAEA